MKLRKAVGWTAGVSFLVMAAAVAWPDSANKVFPGSGERAAQLRAALPDAVTSVLPSFTPAAVQRYAQAPAAGQSDASPGRGGGQGQAQGGQGQAQGAGQPPGGGGRGGAAANRPPALVVLDKAEIGSVAVIHESVGTVQPIATVTLRSRVDAQVQQIAVSDGAVVKQGDVIAILDSRQIEAQIRQAEASLARNQAALEQARRDVARFSELLERSAGTKVNFDNAQTQVLTAQAAIMGDQAQIENLKVQLSYFTIRAPIAGRIGVVNVRAGNIIRAGDNAATGTIATIVQTAPIYAVFSVPQRLLGDYRGAIGKTDSFVEATPQGAKAPIRGRIAFVDNVIDQATGAVAVRAEFDNADEGLWPGQLCNLRVALRSEPNVISIPRVATQSGQTGNFVFVVENGVARVRPIKISRTQEGRDIIAEGLKGGESIVVEGALALVNGARVETRNGARKDI